MNPVEIGKGRSFKGLASYLLNGPKAEAQQDEISDRVAWSQSFNLLDTDAARAWRLMAATAMSAEQLKEAAGIRKGKPTEKPVYHYSLNFNPNDNPSEAVQRAAVASSLKAMRLTDYQALAVAHREKDHMHVHVMVNLIHPEHGVSAASKQPDGRPSPLSNSHRKLSQWAAGFEREHGLNVTQGRAANGEARAAGEKVDAKRKPRTVYEQEQAARIDARLAWMQRQTADRRTMLMAEQRAVRSRQADNWQALGQVYQKYRSEAAAQRIPFKAISTAIRQQAKPAWAELYKRQRDELARFEQAERSPVGKLANIVATAAAVGREIDPMTGLVAALSKNERRALLLREHQRQIAEQRAAVRARTQAAIDEARREERRKASIMRGIYFKHAAELKKLHGQQWDEVRMNWRDFHQERKEAMRPRTVNRAPAQAMQLDLQRGMQPR
jgi:hypothetical protein